MKVIVTERKFSGLKCLPEVFSIGTNETPTQALKRIWKYQLDALLAESDTSDPIDKRECWCDDPTAQIKWKNGDYKIFSIVTVDEE